MICGNYGFIEPLIAQINFYGQDKSVLVVKDVGTSPRFLPNHIIWLNNSASRTRIFDIRVRIYIIFFSAGGAFVFTQRQPP